MKWKATIRAVSNGFEVDYVDSEEDRIVVYEEKEDNNLPPNEHDLSHIVTLFYDMLEFFGEQGSKHSKKRIKITYDKQ